jgi:tRNA U34 5-carboxymethylaminomethyl modifying GTPase MnmE/TrmE
VTKVGSTPRNNWSSMGRDQIFGTLCPKAHRHRSVTAGLRATDDPVERVGADRAITRARAEPGLLARAAKTPEKVINSASAGGTAPKR